MAARREKFHGAKDRESGREKEREKKRKRLYNNEYYY